MNAIQIKMIEREYLAMVNAALAGKSKPVQKMLRSQARAEIAIASLAEAVKLAA